MVYGEYDIDGFEDEIIDENDILIDDASYITLIDIYQSYFLK